MYAVWSPQGYYLLSIYTNSLAEQCSSLVEQSAELDGGMALLLHISKSASHDTDPPPADKIVNMHRYLV